MNIIIISYSFDAINHGGLVLVFFSIESSLSRYQRPESVQVHCGAMILISLKVEMSLTELSEEPWMTIY